MSAAQVSNLSLQNQIMELSTRIAQIADDVVEIKKMLKEIETRVRALETTEAGSHPLLESRLDAAWRKLEEHTTRIKILEDTVLQLKTSNRIMTWLGGLLGSTVIVWLITQILQSLR